MPFSLDYKQFYLFFSGGKGKTFKELAIKKYIKFTLPDNLLINCNIIQQQQAWGYAHTIVQAFLPLFLSTNVCI